MIEPAQIDADPPEAIGVATALTNVEHRPRRRRERDEPRAVRAGQTRTSRSRSRPTAASAGTLKLGNKNATQGELYARQERREARVPGVVVPGDQLQPQAVRSARQEDPEVRSRQGGFAGAGEGRRARSSWRDRGSEWKVVKPVPSRSDYSAIEGFLTRLSSSNMSKLLEENPKDLAKYGLDKPSMTVTIGAGSAKTVLEVGKTEDERDLREGRVAADRLYGRHDAAGRSEQELRRLPEERVVRVPAVLPGEAARRPRRAGRTEDLRVREGASRRRRPILKRGR